MAQSRPHSPITGSGRERRVNRAGGDMPGNVKPSWPGKENFQPSVSRYPRKAKPVHPDCVTDLTPHRRITRQWRRDRLTIKQAAKFVRTNMAQESEFGQRCLDIYSKQLENLK